MSPSLWCRSFLKILVLAALVQAPQWSVSWAQNENETVGFRPNHAFESGTFGENIDILNGGLNLSVPVAQRFQINSKLGYGLTLAYNSKVWDTSDYNSTVAVLHQVVPTNMSPFGIGFSLQFGRITKDIQYLGLPEKDTDQNPGYIESWKWISPDGTQHEFFDGSAFTDTHPPSGVSFPGPLFNRVVTSDLGYTLISGPSTTHCPAGLNLPSGEKCFKVEEPGGIVYTLVKRVDCVNPPNPTGGGPEYGAQRAENQSFCGWYTALIEDRTVGSPDATTGFHPHYAKIVYDTRTRFEHAISQVEDSVGRVLKFHSCEWGPGANPSNPNGSVDLVADMCLAGSKDSDAPGYAATKRAAVATTSIEVPVFGNDAIALVSSAKKSYSFVYEYVALNRPVSGNTALMPDPTLKLVRVDYPEYRRPGQGSDDAYSLYFGYQGTSEPYCGAELSGNFGELSCRTLPVGRKSLGATSIVGNPCQSGGASARITYTHNAYYYISAYLSGGRPSAKNCAGASSTCSGGNGVFYPTGMTRQVATKTTSVPEGNLTGTYKYCRSISSQTNPTKVVVSDPHGNETVYRYRASVTGSESGTDSEDGLAPEWSDGLNFQIEQYEGTETAGRLVRTTTMDHDADVDPYATQIGHRSKANVRVRREVVRYDDDGGRERETWRNGWNNWGEWTLESTAGFDVPGTTQTRREFLAGPYLSGGLYMPNLATVEEVSDGSQVLTRSDSAYDGTNGRLLSRIERSSPPPFGTPGLSTQFAGDVKTTFTYSQASGNVIQKQMTAGPADAGYAVKYTYAPSVGSCAARAATLGEAAEVCGGYLRTKAFLNGGVAGWKAIDRDRDANTGLALAARDTASIPTTYTYDPLGRVGSATPQGEETTTIDYVSLQQTTATQGSGADMIATSYTYDGLGRQIATAKRSYDPDSKGVSCQTTKYDKDGRTTFKSEWWFTTQSCAPGAAGEVGTAFKFTESDAATGIEPFGRVRRAIPPDGNSGTGYKVTKTDYFGTSNRVTINDVAGLPGTGSLAAVTFPSVTTFYRDARERLLYVDSPSGGRCSHEATTCSLDSQCPSGETCVLTDGGADAIYTYDALDRLLQVDLANGPMITQTRRFEYDGVGRQRLADMPESGVTTNTAFDALGNVLESRDAAGNAHRSIYDFAGRLKEVRVTTAGGSEKLVARNTYDQDSGNGHGKGKLTTIESFDPEAAPVTTEQRTYDGLGARLSRTAQTFADWTGTPTITTDYAYDTRGQLITAAYPLEAGATRTRLSVTYTYKNGYLLSAKQTGSSGNLADVTYNAAGGVASLATPGGGRSDLTFDPQNRPKTISIGEWNGTGWDRIDLETGDYSYDGAGNIAQIGPTTFDPLKPWVHTNRYYYDAANRLARARTEVDDAGSLTTYMEDFTYDPLGNMTLHRLEKLGSPGLVETDTFTMAAANNNRVQSRRTTFSTSPGKNPANVPFTYDLTGNLVEAGRLWWETDSSSQSKIQRYEYDARNRLVRVHNLADQGAGTGLSEIGRYGYDASGNRVWRQDTLNGIRTYFVRDAGGQVLSEFRVVPTSVGDLAWPGSQEWAKDYVYFAGRLLSLRENLRPEAPAGLVVTALVAPTGYSKFKVTWNESTEPDKQDYIVYRYREDIDTGYVPLYTVLAGGGGTNTYTDTDLHSNGIWVHYQVSCRDTAAYESTPSAPVLVLAGDVTKPSRPTLAATAGDRRITLAFSSSDSSGLRGYRVYRGTTSSNLVLITSSLVTETTYVDTNLNNGTTYWYQVDALDALGRVSDKSCQGGTCPLSALPKDYAPPSPPQGLSVGCGVAGVAGAITLAWAPNPATDNVAHYYLYRSTTPDFSGVTTPIATITPPAATTYPDNGLAAGVHYYALRAADVATPANLSAWSAILSATAKGTGTAPTQRIWSEAGDGIVNLSWWGDTPSPDRYRVYRKVNALDSCYSLVGEVDPAQVTGLPTFLDAGMESNIAYDYAITKVTAGVESAFSKPTLGIPVETTGGFSQCEGPSTTIVFWKPPVAARPYQPLFASTADGTVGFLGGYHLYHYAVGKKGWNATNCNPQAFPAFTCEDDGLIRTIVQNATDPIDRYRLSTTQDSFLAAPLMFSWNDHSYHLSETTPVDPPFSGTQEMFLDSSGEENNCAMPRAVYKIYAEGTWLSVESGWPDYFDPLALHPHERCDDALRVYTSIPQCGAGADPHGVPAPTNLTVTADGPGAVNLTWAPPTVAAGAPPIAGYYVYGFADAPLGGVVPVEFEFRLPLPFATLGPDDTSLRITGLTEVPAWMNALPGTYKFRVVAFNVDGYMSSGTTISGGTTGARPSAEITQPGVPRSLKTVLWTLNDSDPSRPRSREGIKLAWDDAIPVAGWGGIQGYRVYRSEHSDGPYCALLQSGFTPVPALPAGVSICPNSGAPAGQYSAGASGRLYWDRSVEPGAVYHYRVTQLELDSTSVVRETPFNSAEQTAGRELLYRPSVLPPPQGFKAYAPLSGADMKYVYLNWCGIPTPDASETLPAVAEYRLYKKTALSNSFFLFARISPSCLATDGSGNHTNRCVVDNTNACYTIGGSINPDCPVIAPSGSCTGSACAVVDQTFNCWPEESASISIQRQLGYTYMVTAQGTSADSESVFSNQDHAWLNYCGVTLQHTCGPVSCRPHRDPEGSAEGLVCGDEQVRLDTEPEWPVFSEEIPAPAVARLAREDEDPGYRIIGQGADIPSRFVFYHVDHLGSPRAVLDTTGARVSLHHYLPFGEERPASTDPTIGTKAFTGHERDAETGMDYMLARYYSSSLGRFMAVDPAGASIKAGDPQSWNRYAYVRNNPVRAIDPTGMADVIVNDPKQKQYFEQQLQEVAGPGISLQGNTIKFDDSQLGSGVTYSPTARDALTQLTDTSVPGTLVLDKNSSPALTGVGEGVTKGPAAGLGAGGGDLMVVQVSGRDFGGLTDAAGAPVPDPASMILTHEIVGHVAPAIQEGVCASNAVATENVIRQEIGMPQRKPEATH